MIQKREKVLEKSWIDSIPTRLPRKIHPIAMRSDNQASNIFIHSVKREAWNLIARKRTHSNYGEESRQTTK
jgi:hypothetical protein